MQINPWALPALLLTATSSFQQEKKHSSVVHSEHYRDQFCFKAPFPSSMSFALIYSESEGSRTSTPRITLPWWRKETGGCLAPKGAPSSSKAAPSSLTPLQGTRAPGHSTCSHPQFLSKALSGTRTPAYARIPASQSITAPCVTELSTYKTHTITKQLVRKAPPSSLVCMTNLLQLILVFQLTLKLRGVATCTWHVNTEDYSINITLLEAAEECPHTAVIWQLMETRTLPNRPHVQ